MKVWRSSRECVHIMKMSSIKRHHLYGWNEARSNVSVSNLANLVPRPFPFSWGAVGSFPDRPPREGKSPGNEVEILRETNWRKKEPFWFP